MAPLFHVEALLPTSIAPKVGSVLHAHVYPQLAHVLRAVARLRALLVDVLTRKRTAAMRSAAVAAAKGGGKRSKVASSTRGDHPYYDYDYPVWNVVVPVAGPEEEVLGGGGDGTAECGYLCWLEEERRRSSTGADVVAVAAAGGGVDGAAGNEIDRLAEKFIARLHARFQQESYRRYQDMMARSV